MAVSLDYSEIRDGHHFEQLVAAVFRSDRFKQAANSYRVDVSIPAEGIDGGVDLSIAIHKTDGIENYVRRYVIQCKFVKAAVGLSELSNVNIPALYTQTGLMVICLSVGAIPPAQ